MINQPLLNINGAPGIVAASVAGSRGQLVADQLTAPGEDRWTVDQAARYYWLLLAESHLTRWLFGKHAAEDRGAAIAHGIGDAQG